MTAQLIGGIAAALSVAAFAPQAWRIIRTRETRELATLMWVTNVVAFSLWAIYGIASSAWEIVIPNVICLAFSTFILVMKLVPRPTRHAIADALDPTVRSAGPRPPG